MNRKILSIVVPVFNMEDCLGRCLDSLIVANPEVFRMMEVIVVNDGSTDGTSALAHSYAERYPSVFSVIDKSNGNSGSCVNAGLAVATGKYFRQLDADDYMDTELLERFIPMLCEWDEDLVSTPHRNCYPNGRTRLFGGRGVEYGRTYLMDDLYMPGVNLGALSMHSLTYKLDLLRSYGHRQQEGIYYTDVEQCYFATAYARDIRFCDLCLYQYVFGREGQSVTYPMYSKNREHLLKVSMRLTKDFISRAHSVSYNRRILLIYQVLESLKPVYWIYLMADYKNPDFLELDSYVVSNRELTAYAEASCILDGIPYVKLWHINGLTPHFIYTCLTT